jgi:UDP-N-acetylbacillosamine N-acetyltransferase
MSDNNTVYIFGYSGHSYVIIESLLSLGYKVGGYFDKRKSESNPYDLVYMGNENEVDVLSIIGDKFVFPAVGDNFIRKKLIDFFEYNELNQIVIVDPSANVSASVNLSMSTYVGKNVIINAKSKIGKGVILNTACIIEHENIISDYSHVAPGAVICGKVFIGEYTFIGANTVIKQNLSITSDNVIGAGSVVLSNIDEKGIWVGNKLRKL